jgi:hypothetical protein
MSSRRRIWIVLIAAVVAIASLTYFFVFGFDLYIVTKRRVLLNEQLKHVTFVIDGYYLMPITPHGAFPSWSDSVLIKVSSEKQFEQFILANRDTRLIYPNDYEALIGEQISGEVLIDSQRKIISLQAVYRKGQEYKAKLNGEYAILTE